MAITKQQPTFGVSARGLYEAAAFLGPIALFGVLTIVRVSVFVQNGSLVALLNAFGLVVLTSMFVIRKPPRDVDRSVASLLAALVGNFLPFCFILRDHSHRFDPAPEVVEIVTVTLAIWTVLCLRSSMGIVPANRGVRTTGPYRIVRHPLYTLVIASQLGLLLAYPSIFNACVLATAVVFKARMIMNEERILARDPVYQEYMDRVRYRAIPGIV